MQIIKHMCKRCIPSTPPALDFNTWIQGLCELLHTILTIDEFQYTNVENEYCWENEAAREEKENNTFYFDDL